MSLLGHSQYRTAVAVFLVGALLAGCGGVVYAPSDDQLPDGALLNKSIRAAVAKASENRVINDDNAPFSLASLESGGQSEVLYGWLEDAMAAELSSRGLAVADEGTTESASLIKYRFIECRVLNAKEGGGRVKRIGRTIIHLRVYGKEDGQLLWAGEYEGEYANVVPKSALAKLKDERIAQIGPAAPEGKKNPFLEPLLVTGITGALIYLFAASSSSQ